MTVELSKLFEVETALNERMVNFILKAIKDHVDQGMDYIKFKQAVQNLVAMNMDESTSVKSAFATASTMGMTKENLIKSIQSYQVIVDKERDKFIETLKVQIANQIEQPKNEIENYKTSISEIERKIINLQKEIEAYQMKIQIKEGEIESSNEKIEKTREDFLEVYEAFTKNLSADKDHYSNLL